MPDQDRNGSAQVATTREQAPLGGPLPAHQSCQAITGRQDHEDPPPREELLQAVLEETVRRKDGSTSIPPPASCGIPPPAMTQSPGSRHSGARGPVEPLGERSYRAWARYPCNSAGAGSAGPRT